MRQSRLYSTRAVVLRHRKFGEADNILTLYAAEYGKKTVVARGARKTKSKLGGHLEVLTHVSLLLAEGKGMDVVSQGETIEGFLRLRASLADVSRAVYLADLVDSFTVENQANAGVFRVLLEALRRLDEGADGEKVLRLFEIQLLDQLGYRPELYHCVTCRRQIEPVRNYFSSSAGGLLCPQCSEGEAIARAVSVDAIKVLRVFQKDDTELARRLRIDAGLALEIEQLMRSYITYLLEREVKSTEWLNRLRREKVG